MKSNQPAKTAEPGAFESAPGSALAPKPSRLMGFLRIIRALWRLAPEDRRAVINWMSTWARDTLRAEYLHRGGKPVTLSDEHQQRVFPGDRAFEYMRRVQTDARGNNKIKA